MRRKPRGMFRARIRGRALYVGPDVVGPEPKYLAAVDELVRTHGDALASGAYTIEVRHEPDCDGLAGGVCDCEATAVLV